MRGAAIRRGVWLGGVTAFCVVLPVFTVVGILARHDLGSFGIGDFQVFYAAADAVLSGRSPYPVSEIVVGERYYVYPPLLAVLVTPFVALSLATATLVFLAVSLASLGAALWLLGVRDWRCYCLAGVWHPVLLSLEVGTVAPLLVLALAAAWSTRDRSLGVLPLAAAIVLKVFLWPVALWLLLTRRWRSGAILLLLVPAVALGSWAATDFVGLVEYPALLGALSDAESGASASVYALAVSLGATAPGALAATAAVALVLFGLALRSSRSGRPESDREAFALLVCAALVTTPLLWPHYLAVLLVPVALLHRRLSVVWVLPVAMRVFQPSDPWMNGELRGILPSLVLVATVAAVAAGVRLPRRSARTVGEPVPAGLS